MLSQHSSYIIGSENSRHFWRLSLRTIESDKLQSRDGRLNKTGFLGRVFDLESLPSTDSRFRDAEGDIWQHTVNNPGDWDADWVFHDDDSPSWTAPTNVLTLHLGDHSPASHNTVYTLAPGAG
jgi:hypothetical protein